MPDIFGSYPVVLYFHLGTYHTVSSLSPVAGYIILLIIFCFSPHFFGGWSLLSCPIDVGLGHALWDELCPPQIPMLKS